MAADVHTRPASAADLPAILELARAALGWTDADTSYLEWKHLENPFGASPMWVAECDAVLVGFRTFLRWEFVRPDGRVIRAVRAVDTATAPEYQGRGIFRRLTLDAVEELQADGVDLIFNTPNTKSLPGYLTMGWHEVGRLPVAARPNRWRFPVAVVGARRPATRDSVPSRIGEPAEVVLDDAEGLESLLASQPAKVGLATHRTPAQLRWRYGNPTLGYRAVHTGDVADGLAVFRLRRRGSAVEAVVCDVLAPKGDPNRSRSLVSAVGGERAADYLLRLGCDGIAASGFMPLPRLGPTLTARPLVGDAPSQLKQWTLTMGDIELL